MLLKDIRENFQAVNLEIIDLFGKLRKVTVPISYFTEEVIKQGVGFDASNFGYADVTSSDLVIVPDLSTAWVDPFLQNSTVNVFGTINHFPNSSKPEPFCFDPHIMLNKALEYLRKTGIASDLMILPELEFHIFEEFDFSMNPMSSFVDFIESETQINNSKGYHISRPDDQTFELRAEMVKLIEQCNIPVKYHHHEVGLPGQQEIELNFLPANRAADAILISKFIVRNVASNEGFFSTFMPKPVYNAPGNGMHMHMYLVDDKGKSIFFNADHPLKLSKIALNFMGGILKHLGSIMAFSNPSTNSYKRLIQGYEAPSSKTFAKSNRNAAIRIPAYTTLEKTRFEYRTGDATCNPYLTISALLLAGIDGLKNNIDPFDDTAIEKENGIPTNLFDAFKELEKDNDYLKEVFSIDFINMWISKKTKEAFASVNYPNPAEYDAYINY
ncbi:MAG: glutamine synthetase beta-grasp domain-containing protein [Caldisericia bacterium]|nr:glutamine synthetase beta-grasp domain-containing protein [Caldisericia bacterium]